MLRTTNGGFNWVVINNYTSFFDMQIIDSTTLYLVGRGGGAVDRIQRTFNRGLTWDSVSASALNTYSGLSFVNKDTGWISGANEIAYDCIWKTTNGGVTLTQITDTTGMGQIFFLKNKINGEYYGWHFSQNGDNKFWKTTNSGNNWFQITRPPAQYLGYFSFIDENTGWFSAGSVGIYKTTNGGFNWIIQNLPTGGGIEPSISRFKIINYDTLYGTDGLRNLGGGRINGLIWKTTNSGMNWGFQEPDTAFHNEVYGALDFINANTGWAYQGNGVHTTNGGGPIIFTEINNNISNIPESYELKQNYPNPFNPTTTIEFSLPKDSYVKLKIFDISGKIIFTVINDFLLYSGNHKYTIDAFNTLGLSSGVYFYRIEATGRNKNNEVFIETKKMLMIK
jgi:photosystem II stability/assembly factor-like uncharacterized protein